MKLARTKEWRESHGLTQRELAAEAGVGEVTVARIETGASVTPVTARKVAQSLGVSVEDLLESPPVPLKVQAPTPGRQDQPTQPSPEALKTGQRTSEFVDFFDFLVNTARKGDEVVLRTILKLIDASTDEIDNYIDRLRDLVRREEELRRELEARANAVLSREEKRRILQKTIEEA